MLKSLEFIQEVMSNNLKWKKFRLDFWKISLKGVIVADWGRQKRQEVIEEIQVIKNEDLEKRRCLRHGGEGKAKRFGKVKLIDFVSDEVKDFM